MDHSVHKITVYRIVSIALLIVLALLMLFPLYWIITGSVKGAKEINARVPSFFPSPHGRGCSTRCSSAA